MPHTVAIVMAGGGGTRLWPASRPDRPKQLITGLGGHGRTLLQATLARLHGVVADDQCWVVTTADQIEETLARTPSLSGARVLAEPCGRNTAACVALALVEHERQAAGGPTDDPVFVIVPADHAIGDEPRFRALIDCAATHAAGSDAIVTLGIQPTYPATGYGYIQRALSPRPALEGDGGHAVHDAIAFVEKPDQETASRYLASGEFVWNAGIFVARRGVLRRAFAEHLPETLRAIDHALAQDAGPLGANGPLGRAYAELPCVSIDVAIMERVAQQPGAMLVVPADVAWSDLGSWAAVAAMQRHEGRMVAEQGPGARAISLDSDDTLIWSEAAEIAVVGVPGVAVIASGNRVLVCRLDQAERVKQAVAVLEARARVAGEG